MKRMRALALLTALAASGCGDIPDEVDTDVDGVHQELKIVHRIPASEKTKQQIKGMREWRISKPDGSSVFTVIGVDKDGKTLFRCKIGSLASRSGVHFALADKTNGGDFRLTTKREKSQQLTANHRKWLLAMSDDFKKAPQGCIASFLAMGLACALAAAEVGLNPVIDGACIISYIAYVEDCGAT
jgi:hypothetical protein